MITIFSYTVISRNTPADWKLLPSPIRARACVGRCVIFLSCRCTLPLTVGTSPHTAFSSVVFPHPFGPIIPTVSFGRIVSDTSRSIGLLPSVTTRFLVESIRQSVYFQRSVVLNPALWAETANNKHKQGNHGCLKASTVKGVCVKMHKMYTI